MRFYLRDIWTLYLIKRNLFCLENGKFSEKNLELTGFGLAIMINRMADNFINIIVNVTTIKKM